METLIPNVVVKNTGWKIPMRWNKETGWTQIPHSPGKTMHLSKLMGKDPKRNQIIANFLCAAHKKGRSTIVFADTMDHLKNIHHALLGQGVPHTDIAYYVGTDAGVYSGSQADRKRQREKAKVKPVLLATYRMASEATDIPWLDACVLATPRSDVNQIVGRIRREYPDKKTPVVFDLVDQQSKVFTMYANKRLEWYRSIGCKVQFLN
jgi:superfamily II DNA or RNA helicase